MNQTITERIDLLKKIPVDYLVEDPPVPRSVKIELVPRCNYNCIFCSLCSREDQPKVDMDWELFVKITEEIKKLGVEEVGPFLIGEPFMNPNLLYKAVVWLKTGLSIPYVFITTNGSLAKPDIVEFLMKEGLNSLKWSFNASDWDQFTYFTGMPEKYFIMAKRNLRDARKIRDDNGYETRLYCSSIHYDDKQEGRMKHQIEEHILPYVDEFYWLPLYSMGGVSTEIIEATRKGDISYKVTLGNQGRYEDPVPAVPCWHLFKAAHILADGRMTACCADATGNWSVGDLNTQTFMECWHSDEFKKLRRAHISGNIKGTKCEVCALGG